MSGLGGDAVVRRVEGLIEGHASQRERCLDCEAPLHGLYCSRCGQKSTRGVEVSLRQFGREALDSVFSFDSRIWRTLRLLIAQPGRLSVEYWQGRRARYVAPLRLYLFVSFVAFLALGLFGEGELVTTGEIRSDGGIVQISSGARDTGSDEGTGNEDPDIDWQTDFADAPAPLRWFLLEIVRPAIENPERIQTIFAQRLPWAIFLMVPFFAALLKILFRRPRRYFVAHLVFSLHLHAAAFLLIAVGATADWLTGSELPSTVAVVAIVVLLLLSLRTAYADGWLLSALKTALLVFVHTLALSAVTVLTVMVSALSL